MKNIFPFYPRGAVAATLALVAILAVVAHSVGISSALAIVSLILFVLIVLAAAYMQLWLLFMYVLLIILPFPYFSIAFTSSLSIQTLVALLAIALLVIGYVTKKPVWRLSLIHLPLGFFVAIAMLSSVLNILAIQPTQWLPLLCAVAIVILVTQTASPRTARYLLLSWLSGALLFAIAQLLSLHTITGDTGTIATTAILLPAWSFLTANWIAADRHWHFVRRTLVLLGSIVLALPLLATTQVIVLAALFLVIVKAYFMGPRGRSNSIAVALLLAILALCFVAINPILAISTPTWADVQSRLSDLATYPGLATLLLGTAQGIFVTAFGILGLLSMVFLVLRLVVRLLWQTRLAPSATRRAQAIAAISAVLTASFFALWPEYTLQFWLVLTMMTAILLQRTSLGATPKTLPTVIHIIPSFEKIGPVEGVRDLTRGLRNDFTPIVVALMHEGSHHGGLHLEKDFQRLGIQTIQYNYLKPFDVLAIYRLWRLFKQIRPRIVHTHLTRPDFYGRIAAHLAGVPIIVSTIRSPNQWLRKKDPLHRMIAGIDCATAKYCTAVVAVSESVRDYLIAHNFCPKEKISVIENAIDIDRFYQPESRLRWRKKLHLAAEHFAIGTVSRAHPVKNIPLILQSAETITKKYPAVRFIIVGRGPDFMEIQRQVARRKLTSVVQLLGERDDIPQILSALDLFVLPSRYEGFPLALAQAQTAGLPCVGTDVSGIRVMIADHKTGLLVPDNDAKAFSAAVSALIEDPALAERLGQNARSQAIRRFDYRRMSQEYAALYQRLSL